MKNVSISRSALHVALALVLVTLALTVAAPVRAQSHGEYDVKAALLYQLSRFFEWPEEHRPASDEPMRVGVYGGDPFGGSLQRTLSKKPSPLGNGFEVVVVNSVEEALACHVVFVPRAPSEATLTAIPGLIEASILVVGEESRFAEQQGGLLALVPDGKTMGMVLNLAALARSDLEAPSQFMRLCRIVGDAAR